MRNIKKISKKLLEASTEVSYNLENMLKLAEKTQVFNEKNFINGLKIWQNSSRILKII